MYGTTQQKMTTVYIQLIHHLLVSYMQFPHNFSTLKLCDLLPAPLKPAFHFLPAVAGDVSAWIDLSPKIWQLAPMYTMYFHA